MAMALTVSPGNLDSLLNLTIPPSDFTDFAVQSFTTTGSDPSNPFSDMLTSLTVTDTGPDGLGELQGTTLKILAVNDAQNTVTVGVSVNGQSNSQLTFFVLGYTHDAIFLSGDNSNVNAVTLDELHDPPSVAAIGRIISGDPIAVGTSLTFVPTGSTGTPAPTPAPPVGAPPNPVPPASTPGLGVQDTTTNQSVVAIAQPYTGPVANLQEQYINVTPDNLNISVSTPNWFIHSGSGTDAISVSSGTNVLDGGTGSNFLTGGSGTDTFFVDDRGATADIWSTVVGFHAGDSATVWGVTPQDFGLAFVDGQGAAGFTGLTLHATASGMPTASLTLAGFTQADMASGRISVTFGTDAASGSAFMFIHANS
jgi:Ca2+-binding RTX toxin-like protein